MDLSQETQDTQETPNISQIIEPLTLFIKNANTEIAKLKKQEEKSKESSQEIIALTHMKYLTNELITHIEEKKTDLEKTIIIPLNIPKYDSNNRKSVYNFIFSIFFTIIRDRYTRITLNIFQENPEDQDYIESSMNLFKMYLDVLLFFRDLIVEKPTEVSTKLDQEILTKIINFIANASNSTASLQYSNSNDQLQAIYTEITKLKVKAKKADELQEKVTELTKNLDTQKAEIEQAQKKQVTAEKELAKLKEAQEKMNAAALENNKATQTELLKSILDTLSNSKLNFQESKGQNASQQTDNTNTREKIIAEILRVLNAANIDNTSDLSDIKGFIDKKIKESQEEVKKINTELVALTEQLKGKESKLTELNNKLTELQTSKIQECCDEKNAELTRLRTQLAEKNAELQIAKSKTDCDEITKQLQARILNLEVQLKNATSEAGKEAAAKKAAAEAERKAAEEAKRKAAEEALIKAAEEALIKKIQETQETITQLKCKLNQIAGKLDTQPQPYIDQSANCTIDKSNQLNNIKKDEYIKLYNLYKEQLNKIIKIIETNLTNVTLEELQKKLIELDTLPKLRTDIINLYEDITGSVRVIIRIKPKQKPEPELKQEAGCIYNTDKITEINGDINEFIVKWNNGFYPKPESELKPESSVQPYYHKYYKIFNNPPFTNLGVYTGNSDDTNINTNINNLQQRDHNLPPSLRASFNQVEQGYHIALFGYGYSGSGKTYTLLGGTDKNGSSEKGILQYGIEYMKNIQDIELMYAFEEYIDIFESDRGTTGGLCKLEKLTGKIIQHYPYKGIFKDLKPEIKPEITNILEINNIKTININKTEFPNYITNLLFIINKDREKVDITNFGKQKDRIKNTINNKTSSRSHLYLTFKINFEGKNLGYITIIDMAGREDPKNIFKSLTTLQEDNLCLISDDTKEIYYKKTYYKSKLFKSYEVLNKDNVDYFNSLKEELNVTQKAEAAFKLLNTNSSPSAKNSVIIKRRDLEIKIINNYINQIIKEGFYINESINHLMYYFQKKIGIESEYILNTKSFITNTTSKEKSQKNMGQYKLIYDNNKYFFNPSSNQKTYSNDIEGFCLTQSILKFLDTGIVPVKQQEPPKPTKFIMICAIRQEQKYAEDVIATMEFADKIKST
jgi:hypothetical protein